jgi:IclR family mhp operon transcriptional activator
MKANENLQTLQRGLQTLAFLNSNGPTTVTELSKQLSISRPTAYRLLETLKSEGYSDRIPGTRKYCVLPAVRKLSYAINDDDMLTAVALNPINRLAAEIKWPLTLVTPSGPWMQVRITTDHISPYALFRIPPGQRVAILNTTTGILYLALIDEASRQHILTSIDNQDHLSMPSFHEENIDNLLEFAARNKYLILDRPKIREGNLGVPVMDGDKPIAAITLRYLKSALRHDDLIEQYLPKLRALAEEIVTKYQDYKRANPAFLDRGAFGDVGF